MDILRELGVQMRLRNRFPQNIHPRAGAGTVVRELASPAAEGLGDR